MIGIKKERCGSHCQKCPWESKREAIREERQETNGRGEERGKKELGVTIIKVR